MSMNIENCPNYSRQGSHILCKEYKKLGLNYNCVRNRLCMFKESYYKNHSETYIQFGKYKYRKYSEIPKSYLAWCIDNNTMNKKEIEDYIVQLNRERVIREFLHLHLQHNYSIRRTNSLSHTEYLNPDYDYGGDMFDALQGCI